MSANKLPPLINNCSEKKEKSIKPQKIIDDLWIEKKIQNTSNQLSVGTR